MDSESKGTFVELRTFETYENRHVLGKKVEEIGKRKMVTLVWCKICAKHKESILSNPLCKGSARAAVESYIKGTNVVKKSNIQRHFDGKYNFVLILFSHICDNLHHLSIVLLIIKMKVSWKYYRKRTQVGSGGGESAAK